MKVVLGALVAATAMGWLGMETYMLSTGKCLLSGDSCVSDAAVTAPATGGSCCPSDGAIATSPATGSGCPAMDGALAAATPGASRSHDGAIAPKATTNDGALPSGGSSDGAIAPKATTNDGALPSGGSSDGAIAPKATTNDGALAPTPSDGAIAPANTATPAAKSGCCGETAPMVVPAEKKDECGGCCEGEKPAQ